MHCTPIAFNGDLFQSRAQTGIAAFVVWTQGAEIQAHTRYSAFDFEQ